MGTPQTPQLAPGLARKVKKALSMNLDDSDVSEALTSLSAIYSENSTMNRRHLRATIERSLMRTNGEFLDCTEALVTALSGAQGRLQTLSNTCAAIGRTKQDSSGQTASSAALLDRTDVLLAELAAVQRKTQVVDDFLRNYQLDAADSQVIYNGEVDGAFFEALEHVTRVHENCRGLLHTHHQRAGLELLDSMATIQETAFERLCKWLQGQCATLANADVGEVQPLLARAARALRARPVLLRYCADEVATARHNAVFQAFVVALTQGGPGGVPRPIEIHAHDPRRYVGDILAWVHQAIADEKELLLSLFFEDEPIAGVAPTSTTPREGFTVATLLDKVFEGIGRPLRIRIEQLLMSNMTALLAFNIWQLLSFYCETVQELVGAESSFGGVLGSLQSRASTCFHEQMRGRTDKLLRNPPAVTASLQAPAEIVEVVKHVVEVAEAFESSVFAGSQGGGTTDSFNALLAAVVAPLVQVCERSAASLETPGSTGQGSPRADVQRLPNAHIMFLINCLVAIWTPLSVRESCTQQARRLRQQLDEEAVKLSREETRRLLASCGLAAVLDRMTAYLQPQPDGDASATHKLADDEMLALPLVAERLKALFVLASSADAVPEYSLITLPRVRVEVANKVAAEIAAAYALVYNTVADPDNGYGADAVKELKHSPVQVSTLLGVQT